MHVALLDFIAGSERDEILVKFEDKKENSLLIKSSETIKRCKNMKVYGAMQFLTY